MTKLEIAIRKLVADYVFSNLPIEKFRARQVELQGKAENSGDRVALDIADEVELLFAEVSEGHRTDLEFRRELQPLATMVKFMLNEEVQQDIVLDTSTAEVQEMKMSRPSFVELTIETVPAS